MFKFGYWFLLVFSILLNACSQRMGYEMMRQVEYQECIKISRYPAEECRKTPDFDEYQQEKKIRYPESKKIQ